MAKNNNQFNFIGKSEVRILAACCSNILIHNSDSTIILNSFYKEGVSMDKRRVSNKVFLYFLMLMFLVVTLGCSKSDDAASTAATGNATITGEVSGTEIVAIDENNAEQARVMAAGTPKTFTITIPIGHIYRIYLIENADTLEAKIFPLYQDTTNAFSIASVVTIALGFIDTTNGEKAIPTNNPLLIAGVSSNGESTYIPEIVLSGTPAAGTSLSDLVASGLDSLRNGSIFKAKAYFKAAVTNYPTDTTNDGDTARFFYAGTRIAGVNLYSDGDTTGALNSYGDILDRMGCSPGGRGLSNGTMVCPKTLSSTTPTGSEMQTFVYDVVRPELEAALANLNGVSSSFTKTWTNPIDSKSYISDYADVLVYRASIEGALAAINTQYAYNLGADIAGAVNNKAITWGSFFSSNTSFLTLASTGYSTYLATAKTYSSSAADDLSAAIDKVNTRNTTAYLINLKKMTTTDINTAKTKLAAGKASLSGSTDVYEGKDGIAGNADDVYINMVPFFAGLNLRNLLPPFTGNNVSGLFPDATMGGVNAHGTYINNDTNPHNGIPDILEN
jgi:hypothetical protein